MKTKSSIEPLESRIAPATLVDAHTVTYTDVDFDLVTVKISKGTFADPNVSTDDFGFTGLPAFGERLVLLDLSNHGTDFEGATLTITAQRTAAGGDGLVNVGGINSINHDLGAVIIAGDLGRIFAGDADTTSAGLGKLTVQSMGQFGTSTQSGGDLHTVITGALGSLVVKGSMVEASIDVFGGADGKIGSVSVGGSIIGGAATDSGTIESSGAMGAVKIGGNLRGGDGNVSGRIHALGKLASLTVVGGDGATSATGNIDALEIGSVKIGGDVRGGGAENSGQIHSIGKMGSVTIGGSVIGGPGDFSGEIASSGDIGAVKIARDLVGGSITGSLAASFTGVIFSSVGRIASVSIGGSILAGTDSSSGALTNSGAIRAAEDIGSLTVKGSLIGNRDGDGQDVLITAAGAASPTATADVAIKSISIGGRVEFARILAGYDSFGTGLNGDGGVNADAQIGSVTVGGDWIASSLAAGSKDAGDGFGDGNDVKLSGGTVKNDDDNQLVSKISSIVIKGQALGTISSVNNTDSFGFVAQQIGSFKVDATSFPLTAGKANDTIGLLVGATFDLRLREIAL